MAEEGFEIPISFPINRSGAVDADKLLAQIRTQVKGVGDQTKEYNAWLEKNAKQLGDVSKAQKSAADELKRYEAALEKMRVTEIAAKQEEKQRIITLEESKKKTEQLAEATKQAALDNVAFGTETKAAAKATGEASNKLGDLKKSVALVGSELGGLGQLLRYVFSPGLIGAALLAKAIGDVWTAFQTFMGGLAQSSLNAARSIGNIKQAMLELAIDTAKADEAFKNSMDDLERRSKRRVELIALERDAVLQLLDANEKLELAAAKSPEEQAAISKRYAAARQQTQAAATQKEITAEESKLAEKEALGRQRMQAGYRASGGRTPERVKLDLKNLPNELTSLDEQIAAQEKIVSDLSSITTVAGALPYWNDPANYLVQLQAYGSSKTTLEKLKSERKRVAGRQLPLEQADADYGAGAGLLKDASMGREDLANRKADTAYRTQTGWLADAISSGQGKAGGMVLSAAAGADALKAGQSIPQEQAQAIAQVTQLLGLTGQSNDTILNMLSRMNDSQQKFLTAIKRTDQKLDDVERRLRMHTQYP